MWFAGCSGSSEVMRASFEAPLLEPFEPLKCSLAGFLEWPSCMGSSAFRFLLGESALGMLNTAFVEG